MPEEKRYYKPPRYVNDGECIKCQDEAEEERGVPTWYQDSCGIWHRRDER